MGLPSHNVMDPILRDGEASLIERLFEDDSLDVVVQETMRRGLTFDRLRIDRVTKDGPWKSTEESTVPAAVLYFKSGEGYDHLVARRSADEKYALWRYRWTP